MNYVSLSQAIAADGLRIVLVRGFPSPWGQAAKAMVEYKGLAYLLAAQQAMGANEDLVAWAGTNSAPVVAWNREAPINRWNDILLLLERLAPNKPLIPTDPEQRVRLFGLGHEICGELGFGWNRRLDMIRPAMASGKAPPSAAVMAEKYGYDAASGAAAARRSIVMMQHLAATLHAQQARGSAYLIGDSLTAADFYWAAFSNLVLIQAPQECPLAPEVRPMFEHTSPEVAAAVDPILIAHRDRIMRAHFKLPMEL